ncbi:DUF418 domain-containing protein [Sphingomonas aracearum]|uniref:DUF418 domain-containing protein n=1 Tax=Sphingomonas aracearum TaxID=2283317 RepID=A0A369VYK7_9SPHN|nr:DUF418 domain-containing protein [Sphingomonas aracearum]
MAPLASSTEPDGASRQASLDVLRGLAILAILFLNISDMGGAIAAAASDLRHFGWSTADRSVWAFREIFLASTGRGLLEMLFGAGMVILTDRAAARMDAARVLGGYAWRNLVLLGLGLVHVFVLLWPGDILHTYALAALAAMWFRRATVSVLLMTGLFMATLQLVAGAPVLMQEKARTERIARLEARGAVTVEVARARREAAEKQVAATREIAEEDRARSGTPASWAVMAWQQFLRWQAEGLELQWIWEAASAMLIGAALFRLGVLQGQSPPRVYWLLLAIGYGLGLTLRACGADAAMQPVPPPNVLWIAGEWARLLVTLGHLAAVHLLLRTRTGTGVLLPFAAAGRVALSIYVAQSLICLWVLFPPWGLAWYGRLGWAEMMLLALAVDAMLLGVAILYVRRWRIGPVEWAWRSLVERRRLSWR